MTRIDFLMMFDNHITEIFNTKLGWGWFSIECCTRQHTICTMYFFFKSPRPRASIEPGDGYRSTAKLADGRYWIKSFKPFHFRVLKVTEGWLLFVHSFPLYFVHLNRCSTFLSITIFSKEFSLLYVFDEITLVLVNLDMHMVYACMHKEILLVLCQQRQSV